MKRKNRKDGERKEERVTIEVSPPWAKFIEYCEKLESADIKNIKIQDGIPIVAEHVKKRVQFM